LKELLEELKVNMHALEEELASNEEVLLNSSRLSMVVSSKEEPSEEDAFKNTHEISIPPKPLETSGKNCSVGSNNDDDDNDNDDACMDDNVLLPPTNVSYSTADTPKQVQDDEDILSIEEAENALLSDELDCETTPPKDVSPELSSTTKYTDVELGSPPPPPPPIQSMNSNDDDISVLKSENTSQPSLLWSEIDEESEDENEKDDEQDYSDSSEEMDPVQSEDDIEEGENDTILGNSDSNQVVRENDKPNFPPPPPPRRPVPLRGVRKAISRYTGMHGFFTPPSSNFRRVRPMGRNMQNNGPPPPGVGSPSIATKTSERES